MSAVTCWNVSELEQAAASQTVYLLLLIEYPAGEAMATLAALAGGDYFAIVCSGAALVTGHTGQWSPGGPVIGPPPPPPTQSQLATHN